MKILGNEPVFLISESVVKGLVGDLKEALKEIEYHENFHEGSFNLNKCRNKIEDVLEDLNVEK